MNTEITQIFEDNKLNDLKHFIKKRQKLNSCNFYMAYLFYLIQSAGILTTTIATSYNNTEYIWLGVGLNIFASLIHSYEQLNNNIIIKLFKDINAIKNNIYVDEDILIDLDEEMEKKNIITS